MAGSSFRPFETTRQPLPPGGFSSSQKMTEKEFRFVRLAHVEDFERVGWTKHNSLDGTNHGEWSALMEWPDTSCQSKLRNSPGYSSLEAQRLILLSLSL